MYYVQSLNRDMIKMMFHTITLPILLFLLTYQTVQADDDHKNSHPQATSSFSEMISNIMALSIAFFLYVYENLRHFPMHIFSEKIAYF